LNKNEHFSKVSMEITGYSTRKMFDHYNTIDKDDTRKAIERL